MKHIMTTSGAVVAALALAIPAHGADDVRTTGERINLFACPGDFDADSPFHVRHGHLFDPSETEAVGRWTFGLMVDDALLAPSRVRIVESSPPPDGAFLSQTYAYNFPEGLSGQHELRGVWTEPDGSTFEHSCVVDF
jgi:hypothetical protein